MSNAAVDRYYRRLYSDFVFFTRELWDITKKSLKHPFTEVEDDALRWIGLTPKNTAEARSMPKRRGLTCHREWGKSNALASPLPLWRIFRDPNRECIIISGNLLQAKRTLLQIRSWIDAVPFLRHLDPSVTESDSKLEFTVIRPGGGRVPSFTALGIGGMTESNRAHTIIADDCETKDNSSNPATRDELFRRIVELNHIAYNDSAYFSGEQIDPSEIIFLGTPKCDETQYVRLANETGAVFYSIPVRYPSPKYPVIGSLLPVLRSRLDRNEAKEGDPTGPLRFSNDEIVRKWGYAEDCVLPEYLRECQMASNLASTRSHPIQVSDLIVHTVPIKSAPVSIAYGTSNHIGSTAISDIPVVGPSSSRLYRPVMIDPRWADYDAIKAFIDPAGYGEDETAVAIVATIAGRFWAKVRGYHAKREPGKDIPSVIKDYLLWCKEHGVTEIGYEKNFDPAGTYFNLVEATAKDIRHSDKAKNPTEPEERPWSPLLTQVHHTGSKHNRIVDTLAPVIASHRLVLDLESASFNPQIPRENWIIHQLAYIRKPHTTAAGRHVIAGLPFDDKIDALAGAVALHQKHSEPMRISTEQGPDRKVYRQELREYRRELRERLNLPPARWGERRPRK